MTNETIFEPDPSKVDPYVGPRPILSGESLPGRDEEIRTIANLLVARRLVLLYGPSGAGRTSLIFAGILPYLEQQDFPISCFRIRLNRKRSRRPAAEQAPYNRYLFSTLCSFEADQRIDMGQQLTEEQLLELCQRPQGLWDYLKDLPGRVQGRSEPRRLHLLLIFDQFEEVFSLDPTDLEAKKEFFIKLLPVLQDEQYLALFAMREEYLGELDPYLIYLPDRLSARIRITQLSHQNALTAILEPARQQGVEFDPDAAASLVNKLSLINVETEDGNILKPGPTVEPISLQVVCRAIWEKLPPGKKRITVQDVEALDSVDKVLGDYYDQTIQKISAEAGVEERQLRSWIERSLILSNRMRAQYLAGSMTTDLPVRLIMDKLVNAYIVRIEMRRGLVFYELAHDSLVQPILHANQRWLEIHGGDFQAYLKDR